MANFQVPFCAIGPEIEPAGAALRGKMKIVSFKL